MTTPLEQLAAQLAAIDRRLADRIRITRIIIDRDGREVYRFTRTFLQPRTTQGESNQ